MQEGNVLHIVCFSCYICNHINFNSNRTCARFDSEKAKQSSAEVISHLESLLNATSEELEQQRRLNHALLKKRYAMVCITLFAFTRITLVLIM